jgi:hypothetical protein
MDVFMGQLGVAVIATIIILILVLLTIKVHELLSKREGVPK